MSNVMDIKTKLHQKIVVDTIKKMNWENGSEAPIVVEFDTTEWLNLGMILNALLKEENKQRYAAGIV